MSDRGRVVCVLLGWLLCLIGPAQVSAQSRICHAVREIDPPPLNTSRTVPPNRITGAVIWLLPLPVEPPACALNGTCDARVPGVLEAGRAYNEAIEKFDASLPYPRFPAGVLVVFENEETGECWDVITQEGGRFNVEIPAGVYTVLIDHPPFHPLEARVRTFNKRQRSPEGRSFAYEVIEGLKPRGFTMGLFPRTPEDGETWETVSLSPYLRYLEFAIQLHSNSESTTVRGRLPDGSLGVSFSGSRLDAPGASSRTAQGVQQFAPGVVFTEQVGSLAQFTTIGQRRFANRLSIDGMSGDLGVDVQRPGISEAGSESLPAVATSGGTETLIPAGAIEEISVRTSNTPPQLAQAPGAQTSIVTRSGVDRLNGSIFLDARARELGARDQFHAESRPPASENFGGTLGGRLRRGRLYYFVASEGQRVDRPLVAAADVPSLSLRETAAPALRSLLEAFPAPNGPERAGGLAELRGEFPVRSSLDVLSVRADGNLSLRHRAFARVNVGRSRGTALPAPTFAVRPDFSFYREESTLTRTATAGLMSSTRSGRWTGDLRINATLHRGGVVAGSSRLGGTALDVDSLIAPGAPRESLVTLNVLPGPGGQIRNGSIADSSQEQIQATGVLTYVRGRHELRAGVDITHVTAAAAGSLRYSYGFAPDVQLRQVVIEEIAPARVLFETFSAFTQDSWRPTERLTVKFGARYSVKPAPVSRTGVAPVVIEFDTLPELRPREVAGPLWKPSRLDLAPQASVAYQLARRRETTIRAGWNLTYDELTSPGGTVFGRGAPYAVARAIRPSAFPVPAGELLAAQGVTRTEYFSFPQSLRRPRTYGWHVGIDQALGRLQRLSLSYVGAAGRDLPYWYAFGPSGPAPINVYANDGRSDYHGLLTEFVRRAWRGIEARAVYTWSHAIDTDSGESRTPHLPPAVSAPAAERGSADFDRRHVLAVTGTYRLPSPAGVPRLLRPIAWGWQVSAAAFARSGAPFSVTAPRLFGGNTYFVRTDESAAAAWLEDSSSPTGRRLNTLAFPLSSEVRQGTRGRNTLRGSPMKQLDLSLTRSFRFGQRIAGSVRVEAFNVLGVVNTGPPDSSLLQPGFGVPFQTAAEALGIGTLSGGGLMPLQQVGGPRSVRLGVRLGW